MIEIQCDECREWSADVDTDHCPKCGHPRGEYVTFRGEEADAVLIPAWARQEGNPNDPGLS